VQAKLVAYTFFMFVNLCKLALKFLVLVLKQGYEEEKKRSALVVAGSHSHTL
jgi:hypothetical protein